MMKLRPLIIDTDPGADDAIAIMMMKGSGLFDIRAICPVNGNSPLKDTVENTLKLCTYFDIDTRICVGAERPLLKGTTTNSNFSRRRRELGLSEDDDFQYGDQMFDMTFPPVTKNLNQTPAWDAIYQEAVLAGGELEILEIAPHTNLALALLKYPDLKHLIKQIVFMGGSSYAGNHTPNAEFNILEDPLAFQIVLNSGIPLKMIGLDAVDQSWVTLDELKVMIDLGTTVTSMLYSDYAAVKAAVDQPDYPDWHRGITVLHDSLAAAWMIDEAVCSGVMIPLEVELQSPLTYGQTVIDRRKGSDKAPNCCWGKVVDRTRYVDVMTRCVANYPKQEKNA